MSDATLADQVAEWFHVCNQLWPHLYAVESPAQRRADVQIQTLYAKLREKTKPLALAAEQRGISSTPLHNLIGFPEGAEDEVWNEAWAVIKRLQAIAVTESTDSAQVAPALPESPFQRFANRPIFIVATLLSTLLGIPLLIYEYRELLSLPLVIGLAFIVVAALLAALIHRPIKSRVPALPSEGKIQSQDYIGPVPEPPPETIGQHLYLEAFESMRTGRLGGGV